MSKAGVFFEEMKSDMPKDEEFQIEYEKLKPRYEAIEQIIRARKEQNITQAELAKRVGTRNRLGKNICDNKLECRVIAVIDSMQHYKIIWVSDR